MPVPRAPNGGECCATKASQPRTTNHGHKDAADESEGDQSCL